MTTRLTKFGFKMPRMVEFGEVMSGGRLPAALFMVFLLDSKGAKLLFTGFSWIQKVQTPVILVDI